VRLIQFVLLAAGLCGFSAASSAHAPTGLLSVDHYLLVKSTAPAMAGQDALIYVREVAAPNTVLRGNLAKDQVVLFVHGAGTPAAVGFDVPYKDYSWMAYLARAGYDVFAMDQTGYGRSTRPTVMNNPCNFLRAQQAQFVPGQIAAPCEPTHAGPITTMGSDWDEIGAVVDHLRALRQVERVALVAWSQGGPRAGGYAARNPGKVSRLVVLAPAYNRDSPTEAPGTFPAGNGAMTSQSRGDFVANWERQVGCADQYESATSATVWRDMLASDPVGATWGTGVRRAPQVPTWGFNKAVVATMQTPFLMIAGVHDKQVLPERVRMLYDDLGVKQKVFIDLACSSHNAMWEKNHLLLFKVTLDWLREGKVDGQTEGIVKLGY